MVHLPCPEGRIELPIDIWYCKLTSTACPIQADIDLADWAKFDRHCLATPARQEGIKQAIRTGKYTGFHHMPGKWLCPMCKPSRTGNPNRQYHHDWELFPLERFVPYGEHELRVELIRRRIPITALSGHLCRECLDEVLRRLDLPTTDHYFTAAGYGEPMNRGEPISFHLYRSIQEEAAGDGPIDGACDWCDAPFSWNDRHESVCIDIHGVTLVAGPMPGFRLCETCGDRFARLFRVDD